MIVTWLMMTVVHLLDALNAQQVTLDLHIDNNNYILAALYYLHTLNQFLPIDDAVLPLIGITFTVQNGIAAFRLFRFIKSFIPAISGGG